jgi:hypothetical protein
MLETRVKMEIKTHILCPITSVFRNSVVYGIMRKNVVKLDRPQTAIRRMRFACWITKATNKHSEYAIHIAFLWQQWLHERTSILRCTQISYVVCI